MAKILKRVGIVLLCVLLLALLAAGGYVLYLALAYYRIEDNTPMVVENDASPLVQRSETYTALCYNIGFGAYDPPFSFFMDTGTMLDGTKVQGEHGRAQSLETVQRNTNGAIETARALAPDFLLFQEVDVDSTRSFHVDQSAQIKAAFPDYSTAFTLNFHTAFLPYPFTEPHGAVQSGLLTLSNHHMSEGVRRSYPIDESFPTKFFDLDRCFSLMRLPVEGGGELVLINNHMSAYDEGGVSREAQMMLLCQVMEQEYQKGNWVIVGGDYNHLFYDSQNFYPTAQQVPDWVFPFPMEDLPGGFTVVRADNIESVPSLRSTDIPYTAGVNFMGTVDGFVVSPNLRAGAHNVDTGFAYSDHNPVLLTFELLDP